MTGSLPAWTLLGLGWLTMVVIMAALWDLQWRTRNAGIVGVRRTFGVGILGVLFALMADRDAVRRSLIGACTGIRGLRPGSYLPARVPGEAEGGRYQALRHQWCAQPCMFLLFLPKLTGVPPTEALALESGGEAHRACQRTTHRFFPRRLHRPDPQASTRS